MISRIATVAALMAGAALWALPVAAQTGTSASGAVNSGAASPSGSPGTTSNTPRNNSSSTSTTMGPTGGGTTNSPGPSDNMNRQGNMQGGTSGTTMNAGGGMNQAQAGARPGRMRGGDRGERQMTECLNNAAAQHMSFDSCHR